MISLRIHSHFSTKEIRRYTYFESYFQSDLLDDDEGLVFFKAS